MVKRATARADELDRAEYRSRLSTARTLVRWLRPRVVCFVGLAGWRAAVDRKAAAGVQADPLEGSPVYVMPNTSGLNARMPPPELTEHLRAAGRARRLSPSRAMPPPNSAIAINNGPRTSVPVAGSEPVVLAA